MTAADKYLNPRSDWSLRDKGLRNLYRRAVLCPECLSELIHPDTGKALPVVPDHDGGYSLYVRLKLEALETSRATADD